MRIIYTFILEVELHFTKIAILISEIQKGTSVFFLSPLSTALLTLRTEGINLIQIFQVYSKFTNPSRVS